MFRLTIAECQYASTTDHWRQRILSMMRELADNSYIDPEFEYRCATMTPENYFIAQLKYDDILPHFTIKRL